MRPIPTMALPAPLRALDRVRERANPATMSSGDSQPRPSATIHAVAAVPTFAPSKTTCAMAGAISSFSTKEATMSAVAVELWRAMVATNPAAKERAPPRVPAARPVLSRAPQALDMPSLTWPNP